jgi:hypothetical protein
MTETEQSGSAPESRVMRFAWSQRRMRSMNELGKGLWLFQLRGDAPPAQGAMETPEEAGYKHLAALRTIAESHAYDHSVDGPGAEGTTPYEWARRIARDALTTADSGGLQDSPAVAAVLPVQEKPAE